MSARRIQRIGSDNWTRAERTAGMRAKTEPMLQPLPLPLIPRIIRAFERWLP